MITETNYKNIPGLQMENGDLSVIILPNQGGKLASLVYKPTGRQIFFQRQGENYRLHFYDGDFVASECSGFDDLFPTIDPCVYPWPPWEGVKIPDHGELCGLAMEVRIDRETVILRGEGVRFPYVFEKRLRFTAEHILRISYRVENRVDFPLECLWAAHPILDAGTGGKIFLPYEDGEPAICTFSRGAETETLRWPEGSANGALGDLSQVDEHLQGKAFKIYFQKPAPKGLCGFRWQEDGTELWLRFPAEKVPWLGVLAGEHEPTGRLQVFLEPCTGAFDAPTAAKSHGQSTCLPPKGVMEWYLELQLQRSKT